MKTLRVKDSTWFELNKLKNRLSVESKKVKTFNDVLQETIKEYKKSHGDQNGKKNRQRLF